MVRPAVLGPPLPVVTEDKSGPQQECGSTQKARTGGNTSWQLLGSVDPEQAVWGETARLRRWVFLLVVATVGRDTSPEVPGGIAEEVGGRAQSGALPPIAKRLEEEQASCTPGPIRPRWAR
ncbi:hypothetical protein NDU88_002975 [Pleurodeles waltl]|uniref:Uncharacterized protein n=1 Tax=Pleurodeles waltl TaxID=8319 RepID=A0AAV7UB38_PLEWA|nr:hypothetical protein NDU88_002975 [Pleurodeles waltl]